MKEKIKVYVVLVLIVGILVGGFIVWQSYQKTEQKYQVCLEKCEYEYLEYTGRAYSILAEMEHSPEYNICTYNCKEKYGK
ncbi:MAG: hypothetical protein HQ539_02195 [Parcubacteria group bacterium]|nr:hypothetical protein [Parcubacteria group bacterium]